MIAAPTKGREHTIAEVMKDDPALSRAEAEALYEEATTASTAPKMTAAARDVLRERFRQIHAENWSAAHDDAHTGGEMARAAACYASFAGEADNYRHHFPGVPLTWPWDCLWWKPTNRRRDLIKAAALIVAEIERLDRAGQALAGTLKDSAGGQTNG